MWIYVKRPFQAKGTSTAFSMETTWNKAAVRKPVWPERREHQKTTSMGCDEVRETTGLDRAEEGTA